MNFRFALPQQLESRIDEQCAECVGDPIEAVDQAHARHDEDTPHEERPENSPEQHLVLVLVGHLEIAEDNQKHEQVIDAERQFDYVTGHELQRLGPPVPEQLQHRERGRQRDPDSRPGKRFAKADAVGAAIKNAQVEHEHRHHKQVEKNPEESTGNVTAGVRYQVSGKPRPSAVNHRQEVQVFLKI